MCIWLICYRPIFGHHKTSEMVDDIEVALSIGPTKLTPASCDVLCWTISVKMRP